MKIDKIEIIYDGKHLINSYQNIDGTVDIEMNGRTYKNVKTLFMFAEVNDG